MFAPEDAEPPVEVAEAIVLKTLQLLGGVGGIAEIHDYIEEATTYVFTHRDVERCLEWLEELWSVQEVPECCGSDDKSSRRYALTAEGRKILDFSLSWYARVENALNPRLNHVMADQIPFKRSIADGDDPVWS